MKKYMMYGIQNVDLFDSYKLTASTLLFSKRVWRFCRKLCEFTPTWLLQCFHTRLLQSLHIHQHWFPFWSLTNVFFVHRNAIINFKTMLFTEVWTVQAATLRTRPTFDSCLQGAHSKLPRVVWFYKTWIWCGIKVVLLI